MQYWEWSSGRTVALLPSMPWHGWGYYRILHCRRREKRRRETDLYNPVEQQDTPIRIDFVWPSWKLVSIPNYPWCRLISLVTLTPAVWNKKLHFRTLRFLQLWWCLLHQATSRDPMDQSHTWDPVKLWRFCLFLVTIRLLYENFFIKKRCILASWRKMVSVGTYLKSASRDFD